MPNTVAIASLAALVSLPAGQALAALEGKVELSARPEVQVAFNETTGSVNRSTACPAADARPIVIYDQRGGVVALVYITRETDNC